MRIDQNVRQRNRAMLIILSGLCFIFYVLSFIRA